MITLSTIIYEGNFEEVLSEDSWFFKFKSEMITEKLLIVNNVTSKDKLEKCLISMWEKEATPFVVQYVEYSAKNAIRNFKLNINQDTLGYNYTIPYFVAFLHVSTPYLLHVASDCMDDIDIDDGFLYASIVNLASDKRISTITLPWVKHNRIMENNYTVGEYEEIDSALKLGYQQPTSPTYNLRPNFTDQLFMCKIDTMWEIDFNIDEQYSNKIYNGPAYGGNSFEKRMVAHNVLNNKFNGVYKGDKYFIHDKRYY